MENTFAFSDNIVGVLVESELDEIRMEEIQSLLNARLEKNLYVSIYIEDQYSHGISLAGFLKSLSFHFTHSKSIKKVAIVTNVAWFQKLMDIKDFVVKAEVKTFDLSERVKAMNWIME